MNIPDFREQRGEFLVLETQGEDLLRVDTAEGAETHQLHEHTGEHQVILRERTGTFKPMLFFLSKCLFYFF